MNNEHIKGTADNIVGNVKEVAGHVSGDKKLEAEGKLDQVKGAAHDAAGDARDVVEKAAHNLND